MSKLIKIFCLTVIGLFYVGALWSQTSVEVDSLFSKSLNAQRPFWVQLPENYNPKNAQAYPVVYMLDGSALQQNLRSIYENYMGHYLPELILVGIYNHEHRTRDLTPTSIQERRGAAFQAASGGADSFRTFIKDELIPHIEKTYKTLEHRTLIGHSFAGLFTIDTLVKDPHLFDQYIAIDPSLDWDNQIVLKAAQAQLPKQNLSGIRLFVSLAAEQLHMYDENVTPDNVREDTSEFTLFARSILSFTDLGKQLESQGLAFESKVYPEDLHGTVVLPTIRDGLVFCFKWFQFLHPPQYNNPETSIAQIQTLLKEQEKIYTKHFKRPTPPLIEELFQAYGYMNMQMGQPEKSEFFFKEYLRYYPESQSAYEGMADFYEAQNAPDKALKFLEEAYAINPEKRYEDRIKALKKKH